MEGVLVSQSVTTGPSDWIHGALWHLPAGLVRVPLGVVDTFRHFLFRTVDPQHRPRREWGDGEVADLVAGSRTVLWLPFATMRAVRLYDQALTSYVIVENETGDGARLRCFRHDHAIDYLAPVFHAQPGIDLRLEREPA